VRTGPVFEGLRDWVAGLQETWGMPWIWSHDLSTRATF
jgi:hypothetical protein